MDVEKTGNTMAQIDRLKEIVETLRSENGCPWDRAQSHTSLKPEVIEEAAEVVCGINILVKQVMLRISRKSLEICCCR